MMVKGLIFLM
ncbi:rCG46210 [Rattus norvegicus]|uniref:RCG46210 n=1 Tax=Rattus norvegicus TaxID=10116 RepID=A6IBW2_RAT|nr:rCG46210 [Rattus norvegicus]